jgi:hypothetical protein
VDLVSNTVVLEEIDFVTHYAKISSQSFPQHALGPAVHELTHHWCFNSPVGSTLALLKLEIRHAIFTGTSQRDVFDPLWRLRIATQILRPIAEGLALFAELDMLPGPGGVRAPIVSWILSMFSQKLMFDKEATCDNLFSHLVTDARTTERGLRTKENLISQPLHVKGGGYLPGYLVIKSLWNEFKTKGPNIADSELFLCYMRSYFYDDLDLVTILLNNDNDLVDAMLEIQSHLLTRGRLLWNLPFETSIREYHDYVRTLKHDFSVSEGSGLDPKSIDWTPGLGLDPSCLEIARARLAERVHNLFESNAVPAEIAHDSRWIFQQRDLIWLGGAKVNVRVN